MDLGLSGNAALVTGSTSGLGKASAEALASEGVNVVINGRDSKKLEETVADLRKIANRDVVGATGDLTNQHDIDTMIDATVDEFGSLDHLVISHGGFPSKRFLETTEEDWYLPSLLR